MKPIPKSLYLVMACQFAIGGAVIPFISLFLRDRGLDVSHISQVFLACSATLLVFPFLWGMLADRYISMDRVFVLINFLGMLALATVARQNRFWGLLLSFTAFYACMGPTFTLINALSFHYLSNPREQFSRLRACGSLGWIVPSLPIFLWLALTGKQKLDFVIYLGIGFSLLMVSAALILPHTPPGGRRLAGTEPARLGYWPALRQLLHHPNYLVILAAFFLVSGSFSLLMFYSPPFLEDQGIDRAWLGPVQCIGVVAEIVLFQWRNVLGRIFRDHTIILMGCVALLVRHLLFVWCDNIWLLCGSYVLAGMVIVFFHTGASILVNTIAGVEVRATAQTLLGFVGSGLGPMFSNGLAGQLAARAGGSLRPIFLFGAGLAGLAAVLILMRRKKLDHAPELLA